MEEYLIDPYKKFNIQRKPLGELGQKLFERGPENKFGIEKSGLGGSSTSFKLGANDLSKSSLKINNEKLAKDPMGALSFKNEHKLSENTKLTDEFGLTGGKFGYENTSFAPFNNNDKGLELSERQKAGFNIKDGFTYGIGGKLKANYNKKFGLFSESDFNMTSDGFETTNKSGAKLGNFRLANKTKDKVNIFDPEKSMFSSKPVLEYDPENPNLFQKILMYLFAIKNMVSSMAENEESISNEMEEHRQKQEDEKKALEESRDNDNKKRRQINEEIKNAQKDLERKEKDLAKDLEKSQKREKTQAKKQAHREEKAQKTAEKKAKERAKKIEKSQKESERKAKEKAEKQERARKEAEKKAKRDLEAKKKDQAKSKSKAQGMEMGR